MDRNTERMQHILTGASLDDIGVRLVESINFVSKVSWRKDNVEVLEPYSRLFPGLMKAESNSAVEFACLVIALTMNSCFW